MKDDNYENTQSVYNNVDVLEQAKCFTIGKRPKMTYPLSDTRTGHL